MKTKAGLWIDHRKAVVLTLTDKGEETGLIISKPETQASGQNDGASDCTEGSKILCRIVAGYLFTLRKRQVFCR